MDIAVTAFCFYLLAMGAHSVFDGKVASAAVFAAFYFIIIG